MSTDRREEIAARLLVIAQGIVGTDRAFRNVTSVSAKTAPAIVVWDGDESVVAERPGKATLVIELTPEIRIQAEDSAANIGATLNALRRQLLVAIFSDSLLLGDIDGSDPPGRAGNGQISYLGCSHALDAGRKTEGELSLNFSIRYPLKFSELQ